jgi:hypothetical protein
MTCRRIPSNQVYRRVDIGYPRMHTRHLHEFKFSSCFQVLPSCAPAPADSSDTGVRIDMHPDEIQLTTRGTKVIRTAAASLTPSTDNKPRIGARRKVRVPGRLTWRDSSGTLRFVSVMTCDVSDLDAFVECQVPASIPLYRLVHFQIERGARECDALPLSLRNGKVLSAVYRVGAYRAATGTPHGYALRLLVEPARSAAKTMSVVAN